MSALPVPSYDAPLPTLQTPPPAPVRAFPAWSTLLDPRAPYLIPILFVVVTRGILSWLLPLAAEDAFITFRYARNFASGLGPVYNPGERVMGFTSPLWMAWNTVGWWLTHEPVVWARLWTTLADVMSVVCGAHLIERHVSRRAAWCFAFALSAWIGFAGVAISGMENGVLVALVLLTACLADAGSRATGIACGALALVRPEGLVAAVVVAISARWRDRLVALAIAALGYGALALYFGTPLPNSMVAKAQMYGMHGPWLGRHWWEWAFPFALGRWPIMPDGRFLYLSTILLAPAVWEGARELWRIRKTPLAFAIVAFLAIWAGYSLSGAAYFYWYLVVPVAGWFVLASLGLPRLVRGGATYVSVALFMLGCWTVVWELYAARSRAEGFLAQAADYLKAHSHAGDKVLLEPIGIIGFRTDLIVLDEVGLVTPAVARRRLEGPGWMPDVVAAERPEWLVVRRGVFANLAAFAGIGAPFRDASDRDRMLIDYRTVATLDDPSGDAALLILRRVGEGSRIPTP